MKGSKEGLTGFRYDLTSNSMLPSRSFVAILTHKIFAQPTKQLFILLFVAKVRRCLLSVSSLQIPAKKSAIYFN